MNCLHCDKPKAYLQREGDACHTCVRALRAAAEASSYAPPNPYRALCAASRTSEDFYSKWRTDRAREFADEQARIDAACAHDAALRTTASQDLRRFAPPNPYPSLKEAK